MAFPLNPDAFRYPSCRAFLRREGDLHEMDVCVPRDLHHSLNVYASRG